MSSHSLMTMFMAMALMLGAALALGELARRLRQPAILGEIIAGILLGPTVLGRLAPSLLEDLFPARGPNAMILQGITMLAAILFLLVAGMELDLSSIRRQGRIVVNISLAGIAVPFALGFVAAWFFPGAMGIEPGGRHLCFALFVATALSISALPVIARTLLDLNLYRTDLGITIVTTAIVDDLAGWIIFGVILSMMDTPSGPVGVGSTIAWTLGFATFMLTAGRWIIGRLLPWVQSHASFPAGVLGVSFTLALLGAALTEWIGIHAIFGSFLVGVAIGDSPHLREQTRTTLRQFISFIFAPLFFVSIGMKVDFISNFDLRLTLVVLAIACAGKVLGCGWCARLCGINRREAWAIGFGLNARGAMEIILGLLALQYGLIGQRLFVALVIMALVTSMMSGPVMALLLRRKKPRRFYDLLGARTFLRPMRAALREEAILELAGLLAAAAGLPPAAIRDRVLARERTISSGLDGGIAAPNARIGGLAAPLLALGVSETGIDFDAPDGSPARLIFLLLTPERDDGAQVELLADISGTFADEALAARALQAAGCMEFLALVKTEALD